MTLFFSLLPLYLLGNLHCLGMCGPLVMLLSKHPYRHHYFLGRLFSYSLVGMLAGEIGGVLYLLLKPYHLSETIVFTGSVAMIAWGISHMTDYKPKRRPLSQPFKKLQNILSTLLLQEKGSTTFLFGALTVLLPCGQTLLVFSACALSGEAWIGLINGFALALLTSPSLALAMRALPLFSRWRSYEKGMIGSCAIGAGALAFLRGCAECGWIEHLVLNPGASPLYHIVLF